MHLSSHGSQLRTLLGLEWAPVAVAYHETAPDGVPRVAAAGPSGCSYWKLAAEGQVFYTEAADHYNCPVGAYTHHVELPPEKAQELTGLIETMVGLKYLRLEEVPQIPRRTEPLGVAIYAPLEASPVEPDVIVVRGNPRQVMLLNEAAGRAGAGPAGELMGRPTCAMLPAALQSERMAASLGCIGNRVYTGIEDEELYVAIPGRRLPAIVEALATILEANRVLRAFHESKLAATASPHAG